MTGTATDLAAVQSWLQQAVMAPNLATAELIDGQLKSREGFSATAGLAIYRRAFLARIAGAMRAQFPALCHALGESLFNDFAHDFVGNCPPTSYTLHDLGLRFAQFLEDQRPDRDSAAGERELWIDFMIDLARFEYELFRLYDAPGAEGDKSPCPDTAAERLILQPAVILGRYQFNVAPYYHAVRRKEPPPSPAEVTNFVALVRKDYIIRTLALQPWEFAVLEVMQNGCSFAEGLDEIFKAENLDNNARADARLLAKQAQQRWIAWGLFQPSASSNIAER
jgi:hypothetical protein